MLTIAAIKAMTIAAGLSGLAAATLLHGGGSMFTEPDMRAVAMPGTGTLLVAVHEVTRRQWQACVAGGACEALPEEVMQPGSPQMPMTGVNHLDVENYIRWMNATGGRRYRLPTAEEWSIIGGEIARPANKKLFTDPRMAWAADYGSMEKVSAVVQPSGAFGTSRDGIADLGGNVWEWTSTCTLKGAASDHCPAYLVEGLHQAAMSVFVRDPASGGCAVGAPPANIGFRLVADK
jgi:formylglycine-generating enzyme required for sulfatase activity